MKKTYELEIDGHHRKISKGDVFCDSSQGTSYYVIGFAKNTETDEILVVYTNLHALYAEVLASPLSIFLDVADKDSNAEGDEQKYRFNYEMHFDSMEDLLLFKSITC